MSFLTAARLLRTLPKSPPVSLSVARAARISLPALSRAIHATPPKPDTANALQSSNPPLSFPCLDKLEDLTRSLDGGPEPAYDRIVTGYSTFHSPSPFLCDHGGILPSISLAYETWGTLNDVKSNAILIHTGLSGSSHAKSHPLNPTPGWWETFIGPGLYIDTDKFYVICTNILGGCYGSTGPSSVDPADGEKYATRFPVLTVWDMVRAQFIMLDSMGIQKLHASVGSSMGGMQSLAAAALFPDRIDRVVSISACARSHPYSIALRHTQRQVLMSDPHWNRGFYYGGVHPHVGMKLAREIATITYRSGPEWELRFGRKRASNSSPSLCPDFLIETYLDHQGERFCQQYDANSLLYISKAMDLFDMSASAQQELLAKRVLNAPKLDFIRCHEDKSRIAQQCNLVTPRSALEPGAKHERPHLAASATPDLEDLVEGMRGIQMPALVLGVQSDILFPSWQQKEISECLKRSGNKAITYYELDSMYGHDTFLIDRVGVGSAVKGHLELAE
ncbi:homoserine O-acetyltransferase [Jimgerdemannia flammicorona]|uniref:Homoserine O-acetyltransferase n=2 Tax=Jimgerdemannia flammicorona TaxID=994334 RepID=A0A433DAC5_9FUNG|nr:homoserine O-acetyltransferase [Jimgerdemannia flammicorona]RUS32547.1 Alpha/Beta hydrolase protein [Jimgerdemannia flammicorona]